MTEEFAILQIALVVFVALASGIVFSRLKQPDILGYVLTGVILGPSCLAVIPSRDQISILAELGVLMLLFVIGIELNIQTFKKHLLLSSSCVLLQVFAGLMISGFVSLLFNWPVYFTVALGFVLALSSTAVVVNTLDSLHLTHSSTGALAIGILIAQDIAVVPMILTLKALTGGGGDWGLVSKVIASIAFMALFIAYLSNQTRTSRNFDITTLLGTNKDLYMLMSLSVCFAAAAVAGGIGLTAPYGAFLAGLALGNMSDRNDIFVESIRPIQKILLMVFFLSIGLLLDLQFVWRHFWTICFLLILVTIVKTLANITILRFLKVKLVQASFIGVALAQLGEFAFLLTTALEKQSNTSFEFAEKCLIALTVLSLVFSPLWLRIANRLSTISGYSNINLSRVLNFVFGRTIQAIRRNIRKIIICVVHYSKIFKISFLKNKKYIYNLYFKSKNIEEKNEEDSRDLPH